MPHLQFEVSRPLSDEGRRDFSEWVTERYAADMDTTTGHIAVTIREFGDTNLSLGRAEGEPVAVVNADVREGRSAEQRRTFATGVIEELDSRFDIPESNCYVVFTEHPGIDFHLAEGPLESWGPGDDPGANDPVE